MIDDTVMPEMIALNLDDPRIRSALDELRGMILKRFPDPTFEVGPHPDMDGIWLVAIADVDNLDDVTDIVFPRNVDMRVDEGPPVYIGGDWPPERVRENPRQQRAQRQLAIDPAEHASALTA